MASLSLRRAVLGLSWNRLAVPCPDACQGACAYVCLGGGDSPFATTFWAVQKPLSRCPFWPLWLLWQAMPKPVPSVPHPVPLRFGRTPLEAVPQDQTSSASDAPETAIRAMEAAAEDIWSQPSSPCFWTHRPWICSWHRAVRRLCAVSELSMSPSACSTARGGKGPRASCFAPEAKAKIIRKSLVVLAISLQLGAHSSILAQFMLTPVPSRPNATAHPFGTPLMSPFDVAVPRWAGWPAGLGSTASFSTTRTPRRQMRCRPSSGCSLRVTSSERARSTQ